MGLLSSRLRHRLPGKKERDVDRDISRRHMQPAMGSRDVILRVHSTKIRQWCAVSIIYITLIDCQ